MVSKSKQRLIERLKRPRTRAKEGLALVEGPRGCREALRAGLPVRWGLIGEDYLTSNPGSQLFQLAEAKGVKFEPLPDEALTASASTETPQPVLLVVQAPEPEDAVDAEPGAYLYLDQVQDPGNLGALIRSAWAFGLSGVVVGEGSTDPWSPKALRAAAGGTFHVPLLSLPNGAPNGWPRPLFFADANSLGDGPAPAPSGDWILAVGNEGSGVSSQIRAQGQALSVPMAKGVDSLNVAVAGSILMYVLSQSGTAATTEGQTRKGM